MVSIYNQSTLSGVNWPNLSPSTSIYAYLFLVNIFLFIPQLALLYARCILGVDLSRCWYTVGYSFSQKTLYSFLSFSAVLRIILDNYCLFQASKMNVQIFLCLLDTLCHKSCTTCTKKAM